MFAVLMIAISMDYSVFMLHTFKDARDEGLESKEAVLFALKKSFTTISGASLTTIAGFVSFTLMKFAFGADIGWVFAKGILIALLTVILLMPCLLMFFDKLIKKTSHRDFLPSFKGFGKLVAKIRWAVIPVVLVTIVISVYGSNKNNFIYGNSTLIETPGTSLYDENHAIVDTFGRKNDLVVLVPKGESLVVEDQLVEALKGIKNVSSDVISLASVVKTINPDLLYADLDTVYNALSPYLDVKDLHGEHYARIILNLETAEEGEAAFSAIEDLKAVIPDGAYLLGSTSAALDMKETINSDYIIVTCVSLLAVGLIIGLSFKSIVLPLLLLLCVQGGVYINMAIPAITSQAIPYVAYILISTIQLGATIDYAILFTSKYMENRRRTKKIPAAIAAVQQVSGSLLTSGGVLMGAGFTMYFTSSDAVVSQIGMLLGRGAFISMTLVFIFLPALLTIFDKLIQKTTYKTEFVSEEDLGYEYLSVLVSRREESRYKDCYMNFGWEPAENVYRRSFGTGTGDQVLLKLKRAQNLKSKNDLNILQEKCEDALKGLSRVEQKTTVKAISISIVLGLLPVSVVTGSVFCFLDDLLWLSVPLAILGLFMFITPYLTYTKISKAKTVQLKPQIEKQNQIIYDICRKAYILMNKN